MDFSTTVPDDAAGLLSEPSVAHLIATFRSDPWEGVLSDHLPILHGQERSWLYERVTAAATVNLRKNLDTLAYDFFFTKLSRPATWCTYWTSLIL